MRSLAVLAVLLATPAAAQETARVTLPVEAPAGAHPLVADFVAICSAGVKNLGEGMTAGTARGYEPEGDGDTPAWLMAVAGNVALVKRDPEVRITIMRASFPHLNAFTCQMLMAGRPEGFDVAAIGTIPGVEGAKANFGGNTVGHWSFLDQDGEVVTISDMVVNERTSFLSMSRATRTAKAGGS